MDVTFKGEDGDSVNHLCVVVYSTFDGRPVRVMMKLSKNLQNIKLF